MRILLAVSLLFTLLVSTACKESDLQGCIEQILSGPMTVAATRDQRFEGKVTPGTARCRGGDDALRFLGVPWVDWANYYGTRSTPSDGKRGVGGALIDLEYERLELIKFNLFDNSGTYESYVKGSGGTEGPALKTVGALA